MERDVLGGAMFRAEAGGRAARCAEEPAPLCEAEFAPACWTRERSPIGAPVAELVSSAEGFCVTSAGGVFAFTKRCSRGS